MQYLLFIATLLMLIDRARSEPSLASDSDFGMFKMLSAAGSDARIYFKPDLNMVNKVHVIMSIPLCSCIAYSDVQKINQLDYMGAKDYLFSFATYVNDGKFGHNRSDCALTTMEIQQRTALEFNLLGKSGAGGGTAKKRKQTTANDAADNDTNDLWDRLMQELQIDKAEFDTYPRRIEGAVLAKGIADFLTHSFVNSNRKQIFETDKSGGIMLTQGTVMIRPCLLFPWFESWILDSYSDDETSGNNHRFKYTLPYDAATKAMAIPYYTEADAIYFNRIVDKMKKDKIIKEKHTVNLIDNTGSANFVRTFDFQALFIPHRYTQEFLTLLEPFAATYLSPYLYVPFVYQMMWDRNEWIHMTQERNNTIYATRDKLLTTCAFDDIADSMLNINEYVAADMFYFAYGWCGGYPVDVRYVMERSKMFVLYHFYEVMFFLFMSIVLCACCCYGCCGKNRPLVRCLAYAYAKTVVCVRTKCNTARYSRLDKNGEGDQMVRIDSDNDNDNDNASADV